MSDREKFEQALAEALVGAMPHKSLAEGVHLSPAGHMRLLAPKIADAIRDAMYGAYWCSPSHGHAPLVESGWSAALKSLRGER